MRRLQWLDTAAVCRKKEQLNLDKFAVASLTGSMDMD